MGNNTPNRARQRADQLIDALCGSNLAPALRRRTAQWLLDAPNHGVAEAALSDWAQRNVVPQTAAPSRAARRGWRKLSGVLGFSLRELPAPVRVRQNMRRAIAQMAAVLVLAVLVTEGALFMRNNMHAKEPTAYKSVVLAASNGKTQTFILPDGSLVRLMGGSTLTYPMNFTQRNVELDGEAFFDVAHDAAHPFAVRMKNMSVRVLGTEFWVDGRSESPAAEVILLQGRVRVDVGTDCCMMEPGDRIVVDRASGRIIERTGVSLGWQMRVSGSDFNISRMPAREALRTAADYFGLAFLADTALPAGEPLSLIAQSDMTVEEIIAIINQLSPDIEGRVENGTLIATRK